MWNERNLFIFNKHSLEETDASPVQNTVELDYDLFIPSVVKTLSYILSIRMLLFGSELWSWLMWSALAGGGDGGVGAGGEEAGG